MATPTGISRPVSENGRRVPQGPDGGPDGLLGPVLLVDLTAGSGVVPVLARLMGDSLRLFGRRGESSLLEELPSLLVTTQPRAAVVAATAIGGGEVQRLFAELRKRAPALPILLAAETGEPQEILDLLDPAVDDYVLPPFAPAELLARLAVLVGRPTRRTAGGRAATVVELEGMVGGSQGFVDLVAEIRTLAECDATVLIDGETGTGKELCARAIHRLSRRAAKPFSAVNCGAMPHELVENELFGHQRAAFTGASVAQVGVIRESEGGTLFLDEVGSLPVRAQATLLRFAQNLEYRPLGSPRVLRADLRIIAATNTDLAAAVDEGDFRRDLYYRLDVLRLVVPPLRDRREDIPILARHFLAKYSQRFGAGARRFGDDAMALLLEHGWPGNVRELEHVVERAVATGRGRRVLGAGDVRIGSRTREREPLARSLQDAKRRMVAEFERTALCGYLAAHEGNIAHAANAAGKNRRAFWELMRKHGIDAEVFKSCGEIGDRGA